MAEKNKGTGTPIPGNVVPIRVQSPLLVESNFQLPTHGNSNTPNTAIAQALKSVGVTRKGLITELYNMALYGQKVTTVIEKDREVRRTIVEDPNVKLQAIDKLNALFDRAEGSGRIKRSLTYEES